MKHGPAIFTQHHARQLAEEGYTTIADVFDEQELAELEGLADAAVAHHNRDYDTPATVYQSVSKKDGITFVNELADDSPVAAKLAAFVRREGIGRLTRSIAGPNTGHYFYQIVYKHPRHEQLFAWHQDHMHTPTDLPFYNVWIALSDMTVENGCIRVMPRVGLDHILPYHVTPWGHSCWPLDDPEQGVPMILTRGSILVITSRTLHMSGGNYTDGMRKALLMVFMDRDRHVGGEHLPLSDYQGAAV